MQHKRTSKTLPENAKTFSSADMTNEFFDTGLLDLKLLINDFGADYLLRHFAEVYPVESKQLRLALAVDTITRKVPVLLKKKSP